MRICIMIFMLFLSLLPNISFSYISAYVRTEDVTTRDSIFRYLPWSPTNTVWKDYCRADPFPLLNNESKACWAPGSDIRTKGFTIRPLINSITDDEPLAKITGRCEVYFQPRFTFGGMPVWMVSHAPYGWRVHDNSWEDPTYARTYSNCIVGLRTQFNTGDTIYDYRFKSWPVRFSGDPTTLAKQCYQLWVVPENSTQSYPILNECGDVPTVPVEPEPELTCNINIPNLIDHGVVERYDLSEQTINGSFTCSRSGTVTLYFSGGETDSSGGAVYRMDGGVSNRACLSSGNTSCFGGNKPLQLSGRTGNFSIKSTLDTSAASAGNYEGNIVLISTYQ